MANVAAASVAVTLPGGLATEEGQWLRRAELRPLTGQEEDWLIRNPSAPSAVAVTKLLANCLVSLDRRPVTSLIAGQLLVGDRDFLMLQLRRLTLGDDFSAVVTCTACGDKMDVIFKADDVPLEGPPNVTRSFQLPLTTLGRQRTLRFRLPTGADQEAVLGLSAGDAGEALLQRCLLDDGGVGLSEEEERQLSQAIEQNAPRIELELDLTCPSCGEQFVLPFDTTTFFLQELRGNDRNLLREFHSLAFHYHWSQTEILGLDRERRRAYLSLLAEELRRN
jgi:hypothetical protein